MATALKDTRPSPQVSRLTRTCTSQGDGGNALLMVLLLTSFDGPSEAAAEDAGATVGTAPLATRSTGTHRSDALYAARTTPLVEKEATNQSSRNN